MSAECVRCARCTHTHTQHSLTHHKIPPRTHTTLLSSSSRASERFCSELAHPSKRNATRRTTRCDVDGWNTLRTQWRVCVCVWFPWQPISMNTARCGEGGRACAHDLMRRVCVCMCNLDAQAQKESRSLCAHLHGVHRKHKKYVCTHRPLSLSSTHTHTQAADKRIHHQDKLCPIAMQSAHRPRQSAPDMDARKSGGAEA